MTAVADERRQDGLIGVPRHSTAVAGRAHLACVLEAGAPKPGNVSPGRAFADMRYEDFLASADAIARPLEAAGRRPLGETILRAVEATAARTRANTNLGIVLMLAPLARAAIRLLDVPPQPTRASRLRTLHDEVGRVLGETTVDDAKSVYRAIRIANPGGLGSADEQDVADEPTVTLLEAMRLAESRDGVAREYASAFRATFEVGSPALARARRDGLAWDDAVVETYLTLLAASPDTHVARRAGAERAAAISRRAREVLDSGGVRSDRGRAAVAALDDELRGPANLGNPGTTADLTAASIFVVLLEGGWQSPHGSTHGSLDAATR
jgi:triphosphoribosyl-dephospho-CoA synthase